MVRIFAALRCSLAQREPRHKSTPGRRLRFNVNAIEFAVQSVGSFDENRNSTRERSAARGKIINGALAAAGSQLRNRVHYPEFLFR